MKFFIDENIEQGVAAALRLVYLGHEFVSAFDNIDRYCNTLDVDLFRLLAEDGFDVIVTQDRRQLSIDDERRALYDAGLHWVGQAQVSQEGSKGMALRLSTISAGLAVVLDDLGDEPMAFKLKGVESLASQRVSAKYQVWRPSWGKRPA